MTTLVEDRERTSNLPLLINSALASTVGIVIAVLADSLGRLAVGWFLDREPVLYHDRVLFTAGDNPLALAGGALAALIAGTAFLAVYPGSRRHDPSRLAVLWLILHCFRQGFVPLALAGVDAESDVALALTSLDLPAGINVVVGVAGAIGLLLVSLAAAPAFPGFRDLSEGDLNPSTTGGIRSQDRSRRRTRRRLAGSPVLRSRLRQRPRFGPSPLRTLHGRHSSCRSREQSR